MALSIKGQFGTTWTVDAHVITRRTAAGRISQRSLYTKDLDIFNVLVSGLTDNKKEALIEFLISTAAKRITLNTGFGQWNGFILNDEITFTQERECLHNCTFDFEGRKIS